MTKQIEKPKQKPNHVLGRVTTTSNQPLANLVVHVYDRDMRNEALLAEAVTDEDGKYKITWLHSQLKGRGKKEADIAVKVFTREKQTLLFNPDVDSIRFNASPREEINITIETAIQPETVEYDQLLKDVSFLANKIPVADLQESKAHRDISFISRELKISSAKIEHLVVAQRLGKLSKIDADFFYALLRKNTLLKNDFPTSFQARLSIGIHADIQTVLYDAALADPEIILKDAEGAATEMIIATNPKKIRRNIELLQKFKKDAEEYYDKEHPKKILETISGFISNGKIREIEKLFRENKNDINAFFSKVTDPTFFSTEAGATDAQVNIALGQVFGFGSELIQHIAKSREINKPADVRKLARLNKTEWVEELSKAKSKGKRRTESDEAISIMASNIVRKMEKEFPTIAFAAQLERQKGPVLKNHESIVSFLKKHEDFDLTRHNIDLYLKERKVAKKESEAIGEELKSVQRVFKLVPNYSKTNALRKENIHSAQSIVAIGETRFVKEIAPKTGIDTTEAREIFKKATAVNTAAMLIVGELQDTMRAMDVASLETSALSQKLEAVSKDFPNLKSLFKLTDACACEHCRSVYSPAAYLVELLQFLDKRSVTDITVTPNVTTNLAKDVLFERRPDLGEIDLGCENANTPVKYIDLVCELLEEAIAPDQGIDFTGDLSDGTDKFQGVISAGLLATLQTAGLPVTDKALVFETEVTTGSADTLPHYLRDRKVVCKIINTGGSNYKVFRLRQTLSTAGELAAAPEYVNANAYNELQTKSFAFKLPFDLNHVEAKAYFNRFDISRAKLMKDFQVAGNPPDQAIAAEKLGLTDAGRNLIVTPKANLADQQLIWNAPAQWDTPPVAGSVLDYMKRVDHFLDKTNLNYKELDLLLTLKFIDPADNLFIKNLDLSCDTEQKEIANLDEAALDRIHRFLRLQKKTGWKTEVLDAIITQAKLGNGVLDNACLIKAATLLEINETTGVKIDELIGFYGEIPDQILNDDAPQPLYHNIFLNKAKNGFVDEGLLPEMVDGSQLIANFATSLSVCLQIKQQDLEKLLSLLPDGNLTFSNLSYLFAAARLIKKLKLKTDDFVILTALTGLDISASPEKTLEFIEAVKDFKKSPLKPSEVKYMLRHEAELLPDIAEKVKQVLEKLQKDYQTNFTLNRSLYDDNLSAEEQKETLQNELAKLSEVTEEDVKTFISFVDRDWTLASDAKTIVSALNTVLSVAQIGAINGKIDVLDAAPLSNFTVERDDLIDTFISAIDATIDLTVLDYSEKRSVLQGQLSGMGILDNDEVVSMINFIDFNRILDVDAKSFADSKLEFDTTQIKAGIDALWAATDATKAATQKDLVGSFLDAIAAFQLERGKQSILEQTISTSFKAEPEFVKIVLKYAELKQPAPSGGLLSEILQSDTLIDTDPSHVVPVWTAITEINFPDEYAAIKLLHKLLPLINAFKLSNDQLAWYFESNASLGWFEWDSIPYDAAHAAVDYAEYIAFAEIIDLAKQLTPVSNPADPEIPVSFLSVASMLLPGSTATRTQFLEDVSLLTGYDNTDIVDLDAYLFPAAANLDDYSNVKSWQKVLDCVGHLRKLSAEVTQVVQYIKPVLSTNDVSLLRTALKSRYDEDTWLETLKEIMDTIRPQKRNALVAYLLATNPEMKDENDLFDYFLVDVEMESCMPSSRIVQAHGTIQLFVQRCLMGLEPKATADLDNDSGWNQWKWMKNYRVWEANRKVFLYPENWIEPDLRDDKSFLFTEFENELQQNELTEFTAEEALIRYLEKLDNIAFLEVMATWYQSDIKTMHVFARTKGGDPAIYYYRRFEEERYWTPWEKVEVDITTNQLLAFVRNNRLCLAWPVFSEVSDPDQGATLPDQSDTSEQPVDKPRRKLKIQLAISELANKKWQPKKISQEGILTPDDYTTDALPRDVYNMLYVEDLQQIWFFNTQLDGSWEGHEKNGVFNLTGCKGYPELIFQGSQSFPDFYPDFKDALLTSQRYLEQNTIPADELAVRNGISLFYFYEILKKTPENFRLTYPHQFTLIDGVLLLFQYFLQLIFSGKLNDRFGLKIPLGTLLPYFKENSKHAYVIIPGFYKIEKDEENGETLAVQRTGSNVLQLIEDVIALFKKYLAKYQADPTQDINALIQELLVDNDYQEIVSEFKAYGGLKYGEQFRNMYHPLVCALRKTLYKDGISELMKRETQLQKTAFNFETYFEPNPLIVPKAVIKNEDGSSSLAFPIEDLDFTSDGSYSCYNWELFFHVPLLLATRLTKNQRFEEAMTWFHYMFNPTGALSGNTPQKYWVTKPFYLNQETDYINQRIDTLLYKIADPTTPERKELEFAISEWRDKPFKPDVVARFRPVAYQKALLMKYIDNLTEWGDYLFRQDTMESIAQATQMYILADKILGPKPRTVPPAVKAPYETYNQIENKLDAFGNALIDLENILPDLTVLPENGAELPTPPLTLSMLYFCIPQNEKMLDYWNRIADRLFKIRHCQNIDGVERSLALFAPPVDPGMLVRAAASGLDISAVLAGLNAPTPYYRFSVLSQKATELAQEVRNLGNSLLQVLEKKDAESMARLRSELEIKVLNAVKDMKALQIRESKEQIEILKRSKKVVEERDKYYSGIQKIIAKEQLNLDKLDQAVGWQTAANITYTLGGVLALIPDFALGASGFGGSPHGAAKFGGSLLAHSTDAIGKGLGIFSTLASFEANRASITGSQERRFDDWKLQERLAKKELDSIEKQISAAEIRKELAETDLKNHELQIDNAKKTDEFMRSKFTNRELYDWMIGQISGVYFSAYQLSHDIAKKAERSYRFELGNDDTFIAYGYWDSMKKGLQSADRLLHDIKRMETGYMDKNKREYELTKHISLAMLDPLALVRLRATGVCDFDVPEALYDMDHAGQYFRRIKSVSISLPCIAGPYTSVSAKLSLVNNRYRKNTSPDNLAATGYIEDEGNDERFVYNVGAIQSIAASSGQNDGGMFELNFRDERYLPFEGTGAISSWRLELPQEIRQFDYGTIADVIVHIRYTAREGGSGLKTLANTSLKDRLAVVRQQLSEEGLHVALNMKHDLPNEWHLLRTNGAVDLKIDKSRLPYMAQTLDAAIENVMFVARVAGNPATFAVTVDGSATNLSRVDEWELLRGNNGDIEIDTAFELSASSGDLADLEELMIVIKYSF